MKRFLCLMLALLLLPLSAPAETSAAMELDVPLTHDRTDMDQGALRDGSDATAYEPKAAKNFYFTASIPEETPLQQIFIRVDRSPEQAELQVKQKGKWVSAATLTAPGPEFLLTSAAPLIGDVRIALQYDNNRLISIKELRLFSAGPLPASLHLWQSSAPADVLLMTADMAQADMAALALWSGMGKSVALCSMTPPEGDLLPLLDNLWNAGVRTLPAFGDGKALANEAASLRLMTSWLRQYQPLLAVTADDALAGLLPQAAANACDDQYELADAAAHGLWLLPESCSAADDTAARISALAPRSDAALRALFAAKYAADLHSDPASIPYPENRLPDGYLPEGEFLHEDAEAGLWAYLSPTVQVEIVKYTGDEPKRVYFITDVKFKPEKEQFKQQIYLNASFKDQQIYPETLAQTANMVLAINADYYPYRKNNGQTPGNILRSRTVLYDHPGRSGNGFPCLDTVAFVDDGTLEVYKGTEITATQLLERGDVHDTLCFGPYLVRDGKLRVYDGSGWKATEPRTAIGMVEAGHYRIITAEGRMPGDGHQGFALNDLAQLMYAQGVTDGINLDGGSTSVLVFMGRKLNQTGKGTSVGKPRNQHELFGVGTSQLTHTDMLKEKK